jgi:predicted nucleic-acid-binding Zn-ribbon protein
MQLQPDAVSELTFAELEEHLRLAKVNPGHYQHLVEPLHAERAKRDPVARFKCAKCAHEKCHTSELRGTRSFLSSLFNVQSARFFAVICSRCSYSEFYQGRVPPSEQAMDFIFGS